MMFGYGDYERNEEEDQEPFHRGVLADVAFLGSFLLLYVPHDGKGWG